VPGGPYRAWDGPRCLPAPAREEAEQREHENHDEDDPEDAHAISCLPLVSIVDLHGVISAGEQRETTRPGYVTRSVTLVSRNQTFLSGAAVIAIRTPTRLEAAAGDAENGARARQLPRSDSPLRVFNRNEVFTGLRPGNCRGVATGPWKTPLPSDTVQAAGRGPELETVTSL